MPKSSSAVRLRRLPSLFAALAMVAVVSACDSSTGNDGDIASLSVNPPTPVLNVGSTQQLVASPTTSGGQIVNATVTWNSDAPAVATVDANGLVTAIAGGTANISAAAGGETATAVITVWFPVQTISLASPGGITTINQESSLQLTPTFTDATGATVTGRQVVWATSDPAAATVTQTGFVVGQSEAPLVATITATSLSGVVGSFDVTSSGPPVVATVTLAPTLGAFMAPGLTDQFVATARASSGTALSLTGRTVVWTSSDEAVATVTDGAAGGLVSMLVDAGTSEIAVTVDGIEADAVEVEGFPELGAGAHVQGTLAPGESFFYVVDIPAGTATFLIELGGDNNAGSDGDLIIRRPNGTVGGTGFSNGTAESVSITSPVAGRWLVEFNNWDGVSVDSDGATLTITITP